MKLHIKPEQVYIVVFCFFAVGAGCKAAGEYAFEMLNDSSVNEAPLVETASPVAERSHFRLVERPDGVHLEEITSTHTESADTAPVQG